MFERIRRFDVQATYACALALSAVLPCLAAAALIARNYRHDLGQILYGSRGWFLLALAACLGSSAVLSTAGFVLGWSSAGQRRNDRSGRSWLGFFLGGAILTMNIILALAFYMLKLEQPL